MNLGSLPLRSTATRGGFTGHVADPGRSIREQAGVTRGDGALPTPCCGIGFLGDSERSRSTKEASQPPVRAKLGAHVGAG